MNTKIPIEVSARHLHISQKNFEKLFGKNKSLTPIKKLSQPGEFASKEKVTLMNRNKKIEEVRILGPFRKNSQIELSLTDAYNLNLKPLPKIRISGDLKGTTKVLVKGKKSQLKIPAIIAKRHLHCSEKQAKKLKLKNNQKISIRIKGEKETTFHETIVRISKIYDLAMHIDTDEANSAGISKKTFGEIVK